MQSVVQVSRHLLKLHNIYNWSLNRLWDLSSNFLKRIKMVKSTYNSKATLNTAFTLSTVYMSKWGKSSTNILSICLIYQRSRMTSCISTTPQRWIFEILQFIISWIRGVPLIDQVFNILNSLQKLSVLFLQICQRTQALISVLPYSLNIVVGKTNLSLKISLHYLVINLVNSLGLIILK